MTSTRPANTNDVHVIQKAMAQRNVDVVDLLLIDEVDTYVDELPEGVTITKDQVFDLVKISLDADPAPLSPTALDVAFDEVRGALRGEIASMLDA